MKSKLSKLLSCLFAFEAFESMNFTLPDACFVEKCLVQIDDRITEEQFFYLDIVYWASAAVMILVGIPLNFGLVHYEIYGGDPQKRSLVNRMISGSVIANISAGFSIHVFTAVLRY